MAQVKLTFFGLVREISCLIGENAHYCSEIGWSLSNDDPEFPDVTA